VVQEWLLWQASAKLIDWPSRSPDMNFVENMWSEVKNSMQETLPELPPTNRDAVWILVSDAWDEVASSQHNV
jgi:hypothetical protein